MWEVLYYSCSVATDRRNLQDGDVETSPGSNDLESVGNENCL